MSGATLQSAGVFLGTVGLPGFLSGLETGMVSGDTASLAFQALESVLISDVFQAGRTIPESLLTVVSGYRSGDFSTRRVLQPLVSPLFRENGTLMEEVFRRLRETSQADAPRAASGAPSPAPAPSGPPPAPTARERLHMFLSIRLKTLEISVRLDSCLKSAQIIFVGELVQQSAADLLKIRNLGRKALKEVKDLLEKLSPLDGIRLELGMDVQGWKPPVDSQRLHTVLSKKIVVEGEELGLSVRGANWLSQMGIVYVGDIVSLSEEEVLRSRVGNNALGKKGLGEIKEVLLPPFSKEGIRLELGMDVQGWQRPSEEAATTPPVADFPSWNKWGAKV